MKKHQNPNYDDRTARAPYNFVPLPDKVMPAAEDHLDQSIYSGYSGFYDCELETASPLFIRGMLTEEEKNKGEESRNNPEQYSLDGGKTPALPGSSLRGLLRSLVEIAAHARPVAVSDQKQVYRSVDTTNHGEKFRQRIHAETGDRKYEPLVRGGFIRKRQGDYYIQPARIVNGVSFARIKKDLIEDDLPELAGWYNAGKPSRSDKTLYKEIFIKTDPPQYHSVRGFLDLYYARVTGAGIEKEKGFQRAFLLKSGHMNNKEREAVIFEPDENKKSLDDWVKIDYDLAKLYRETLSQWQQKTIGKNGVLQEGHPVFYLFEEGELVFFGHTMMLRLPYKHSPADLLPAEMKDGELDLAEALFGTQRKGAGPRAGRLFVTDARAVPGQTDHYEQTITPHVLAAPKPTTFQHYLVQINPDDKDELLDYDDKTALRGFKLYWHKGEIGVEALSQQGDIKENVSTRIRPVKSGLRFCFRIYFENLSLIELGALQWVLQLAADPRYRLKLGMGKPLGMGAVAVRSSLALTGRAERYQSLFSGSTWQEGRLSAEHSAEVSQQALAAFSAWLLADPQVNPHAVDRLENLPRIQMLTAMLDWKIIKSPDWTRYMEIEHKNPQAKNGKENEYKERPVLPTPLGVGAKTHGLLAPEKKKESQPVPKLKPQGIKTPDIKVPKERDEISPFAEVFAGLLGSLSAEQERQIVEINGKVEDEDDEAYYFTVEGYAPEQYYGRLPLEDLPEGWKEGQPFQCELGEISEEDGFKYIRLIPLSGKDKN